MCTDRSGEQHDQPASHGAAGIYNVMPGTYSS